MEGSRSRSRRTARRLVAATEARSMLCKTGWWFIVEKGQLHMIDHLRSQTAQLVAIAFYRSIAAVAVILTVKLRQT